MITLDHINFSYGKTPLIGGLTLEVKKGEWVGIIGPNGAGKTTLIKLMSGYLPTNEGDIFVQGKHIGSYSRREISKIVSVVPQNSHFAFSFTALEVVLMGRAPHIDRFGLEKEADLRVAREAMEMTDTWQFRDRPIDELSGGELQRVIIARSLAQEPQVLLLDEPTTFLDIKHQSDIAEIIAHLNNKRGTTIVSAMHDVNLAISYCTRIILLNNGRIFKDGDPKDVITYTNLKAAFGADVYVGQNEFTGLPYYVPMKKNNEV